MCIHMHMHTCMHVHTHVHTHVHILGFHQGMQSSPLGELQEPKAEKVSAGRREEGKIEGGGERGL